MPQKEIQPPPEIEISSEMTPAELAKVGNKIVDDKGICLTCHTIG